MKMCESTAYILKDGKEVERFIGVQREAGLVTALERHIDQQE